MLSMFILLCILHLSTSQVTDSNRGILYQSDSSDPSCSASDRVPCSCTWEISGQGSKSFVPSHRVEIQDEVLGSWLQPGYDPAAVAIWELNQQKEGAFPPLCFQISKSFLKNVHIHKAEVKSSLKKHWLFLDIGSQ